MRITDKSKTVLVGLFLLLILLQLLIQIPYNYANAAEGSSFMNLLTTYAKGLFRIVVTSLFFIALLDLYPLRRGKLLCYSLVSVLLISLISIELFLFLHHNQLYGYGMIQVMVETNPREVQEYWSSVGLSSIFTVLGGVALLALAVFYLSRLVTRWSIPRLKYCRGRRLNVLLDLLIVLLTVFIEVKPMSQAYSASQVEPLATVPIERLVWNTYGFFVNYSGLEESIQAMESQDLGEITLPQLPPHSLVVIIGETLRRDYLHCYGYPLPNTPNLDSLASVGDLVLFSDVVSPAPITVASMVKMLSFQRNDHPGHNWYDYPPLLSILKRVGYNISWITNQESVGNYMLPITALSSFADRKEYIEMVRTTADDYRKLFHDEAVLEFISPEGGDGHYDACFVHLLGSHQFYSSRFPSGYAKFSPKDLSNKRDADKDQVIIDYVNSVYYNDYVVSEIIKRYSSIPSIVIYVPDHGEILYDDPKNPNYANHGLLPQGVEIPFMVYLSPEMQKQVPGLLDQVRGAKDRRIMTDLLPNAICGLLGIRGAFTEDEYDFFSDKYNNQRSRIVQGISGDHLSM